ncbi:MAG: Lrp/AsnC family transcriptional regulator [Planctomycetota bacterium]
MDDKDRQILRLLQKDARTPQATIGERVGLSAAAVNERIRRLVTNDVILGFTVEVDDAKVGVDITGFVDVFIESPRHEPAFVALMEELPAVQECHFVTGDFTCLIKVKVPDRRALRELVLDKINSLEGVRRTRTSIVLATPKEDPRIPIPDGPPGEGRRRKS